MNLSASLGASGGTLSASLGAGFVVLNGYVIELTEIAGGHRLRVSRGNDTNAIDILDGAAGRGIAGARMNADHTLTLTFTDGTGYTTPSLRGESGSSRWADLEDAPDAFPPSAHTHEMSEIAGLAAFRQGALSSARGARAYHLGFYIDEDGDLCREEE